MFLQMYLQIHRKVYIKTKKPFSTANVLGCRITAFQVLFEEKSQTGGGENLSTWCSKPRLLFVQTVRFTLCFFSSTLCQNLTCCLTCMCDF